MDKIHIQDITAEPAQQDDASDVEFAADQFGPGKRVTMHFELALADGAVIDSNFGTAPVVFRVGDGNVLPGFEAALFGLRAGTQTTVQVPADKAFGEANPANIQRFPRHRFPADLAMASGLVVNFTDSNGNDQPGVVTAADSARVTVDFNHPLAGKTIHFRVNILDISDDSNR